MRDEKYGRALRTVRRYARLALALKGFVSNRERLVDKQYVGLPGCSDSESQSGPHPGRVRSERCIDESGEF